MFGISFLEIGLIAVIALVVVGPQKLPGMLRTLGEWTRKLRKLTTEVRAQSGIDDVLRQEGIHGGVNELRSLIRGEQPYRRAAPVRQESTPYNEASSVDPTREYPPEGVDAYGALPDDLVDLGEQPTPELSDLGDESNPDLDPNPDVEKAALPERPGKARDVPSSEPQRAADTPQAKAESGETPSRLSPAREPGDEKSL